MNNFHKVNHPCNVQNCNKIFDILGWRFFLRFLEFFALFGIEKSGHTVSALYEFEGICQTLFLFSETWNLEERGRRLAGWECKNFVMPEIATKASIVQIFVTENNDFFHF